MKSGTLPQLLEWAFGEELPKGGGEAGLNGYASAWGRISGIAELGTLVDFHSGRREGMVFHDNSEPHPGALLLGEAVAGLRHARLQRNPAFGGYFKQWPAESRGLLVPFEEQIMARVMAWTQKRQASHVLALVITSAVLRRVPDAGDPDPATRMVCGARGAPRWFIARHVTDRLTGRQVMIERDGYDSRRGRPLPGAYRKRELKHPPLAAMWAELDAALLRQAWAHVEGALDAEALLAAGVCLRADCPMTSDLSPVLLHLREGGAAGLAATG